MKGNAVVLKMEADCFEKLRNYAEDYDILFPKVEALIVEMCPNSGLRMKEVYYSFEDSEKKHFAIAIWDDGTVEFDEEMYKTSLCDYQEFFPEDLIKDYLKEMRKKSRSR